MPLHRTVIVLSAVLALAACQAKAPADAPAAAAVQPAADVHAEHAAPADDAHAAHASALPPASAQPWATDAPLRAGMDGIAKAVATAAQARATGSFDASGAQALAATVDERFQYMLANCKLEPEADVALHALLAQLVAAAEAAKADPASADGVPRMQALLAEYPRYFNHAGWAPVAPAA